MPVGAASSPAGCGTETRDHLYLQQKPNMPRRPSPPLRAAPPPLGPGPPPPRCAQTGAGAAAKPCGERRKRGKNNTAKKQQPPPHPTTNHNTPELGSASGSDISSREREDGREGLGGWGDLRGLWGAGSPSLLRPRPARDQQCSTAAGQQGAPKVAVPPGAPAPSPAQRRGRWRRGAAPGAGPGLGRAPGLGLTARCSPQVRTGHGGGSEKGGQSTPGSL